jgi:nitric oxide reductase large subunit
MPETIVTKHDKVLYTKEELIKGQAIWQSLGVASPDWNTLISKEFKKKKHKHEEKSHHKIVKEIKGSTFDTASQSLFIKPKLAKAIQKAAKKYEKTITPPIPDHEAFTAYLFWDAWNGLTASTEVVAIESKIKPAMHESTSIHNFLTVVFILLILIGLCAAAEWYFGLSEVIYGEYLKFKERFKSKE